MPCISFADHETVNAILADTVMDILHPTFPQETFKNASYGVKRQMLATRGVIPFQGTARITINQRIPRSGPKVSTITNIELLDASTEELARKRSGDSTEELARKRSNDSISTPLAAITVT